MSQILTHEKNISIRIVNQQVEVVYKKFVDAMKKWDGSDYPWYRSPRSYIIHHLERDLVRVRYYQREGYFELYGIELDLYLDFKFQQFADDVLLTVPISCSNLRSFYATLDVLIHLLEWIGFIHDGREVLNEEELRSLESFNRNIEFVNFVFYISTLSIIFISAILVVVIL